MSIIKRFGSYAESNRQAFIFLYRSHFHEAYEVAKRITRNKATAEDIAQEAFRKAFENFESINDIEHFARWLVVTSSNLAIDELRKNKKHYLVDEVFECNYADHYLAHNPEQALIEGERQDDLMSLVNSLKPIYSAVIYQKFYCDLSYNEIAQNLDVSESVLRTRCCRALNQLKEIIENQSRKGENKGDKINGS